MHAEMWEQASVVENISVLRERGVEIVGPVEGKLAGGDNGFGRLAEPEHVVDSMFKLLGKDSGFQTGDLSWFDSFSDSWRHTRTDRSSTIHWKSIFGQTRPRFG